MRYIQIHSANIVTPFRSKQIHIRRCAKEKTFAETENGDLFICLFVYSTTKSQPNLRFLQVKRKPMFLDLLYVLGRVTPGSIQSDLSHLLYFGLQ